MLHLYAKIVENIPIQGFGSGIYCGFCRSVHILFNTRKVCLNMTNLHRADKKIFMMTRRAVSQNAFVLYILTFLTCTCIYSIIRNYKVYIMFISSTSHSSIEIVVFPVGYLRV